MLPLIPLLEGGLYIYLAYHKVLLKRMDMFYILRVTIQQDLETHYRGWVDHGSSHWTRLGLEPQLKAYLLIFRFQGEKNLFCHFRRFNLLIYRFKNS